MPESPRAPEYHAEPVENPRVEELKTKLKLLDDARSRILFDAGNTPLSKAEKKAIIQWMKKQGSAEDWPLDDNMTVENYKTRLAPYGVIDLVDPKHITGKNDIYNLVNRQYVEFLQELQALERQPPPVLTPHPSPEAPALPAAEVEVHEQEVHAEEAPEEKEEEPPPSDDETERRRSWMVFTMLMGMMAAMQQHPDRFEELKDLQGDALNQKLRDAGPDLILKYLPLATRGRMEWDPKEKLWRPNKVDLANLDVKFGLFVIAHAGTKDKKFKVQIHGPGANVEMVAPATEGTANPFVFQFDTIAREKRDAWAARRQENKTAGKFAHYMDIETIAEAGEPTGEYRVTVDHHTDDPDARETSAAQLVYDYFRDGGLIEKDETLERLLAFVTAHDNGEYPRQPPPRHNHPDPRIRYGFFGQSADTMWGFANDYRVSADVLYDLTKKGYKPTDHIKTEDLDRTLAYKERNGTEHTTTLRTVIEEKQKQTRQNIENYERWGYAGHIVKTKYGRLYIQLAVPGRKMPPHKTMHAFENQQGVLIWDPHKHSFFIALGRDEQGKRQTFEPGADFSPAEIVRGHLILYKKQRGIPTQQEDLPFELRDILDRLGAESPQGDLAKFLDQNVRNASYETLYYIHCYPRGAAKAEKKQKQEAVVDELVRREQILAGKARAGDQELQEARRQGNGFIVGWQIKQLVERNGFSSTEKKQYQQLAQRVHERLEVNRKS